MSSRVYFFTARPAMGYCNVDATAEFEKRFSARTDAYCLFMETINGERVTAHVHGVMNLIKPTVRHSIVLSLRRWLQLFYPQFQLDVKVALTPQVMDYVSKDECLLVSKNVEKLRSYIVNESARSAHHLETLVKMKQLKAYAYNNKDYWIPFFRVYHLTFDQWVLFCCYSGYPVSCHKYVNLNYYKLYNGETGSQPQNKEAFFELCEKIQADAATRLPPPKPISTSSTQFSSIGSENYDDQPV